MGERDETSSRLLDRQLQWKMVKLLASTGMVDVQVVVVDEVQHQGDV